MEKYQNRSGNSPITHYQINDDNIIVEFKDNQTYTYSYRKAGESIVEQMKIKAIEGKGLCAYIHKYAKRLYDRA